MKVYPKLEQFLTNLAFCGFTEDGIFDVCDAAGIDWRWPKNFAGDLVTEFFELRGTIGEAKARAKLKSSVSVLGDQIANLSAMATDIDGLAITYRDLCRVQKAIDLAHSIIREPEAHERFLAGFETYESKAVVTTDVAGLAELFRLDQIEKAEKGPMVKLPGFENISRLIGGFDPERLTFILAPSGFGKSNLALNLAFAATNKMAVGYMNLEMGWTDIARRTAVMRSGRTWTDLYENNISHESVARPTRFELRMSNGSELHIDAIISWARGYKRLNPDFGFMIIDYDQKIEVQTNRDTPEWKALHVAVRRLEDLAKKIRIHVVMIAQFNRQGELASSWRTLNTAHSVLKFREHDGGTIVENSIKARHAKYPCALFVKYERDGARVSEIPGEEIFDFKEDDSRLPAEMKSKKKEEKFSAYFGGSS